MAFQTQEFHVGESEIVDLTADATDSTQKALDADEVTLGELLRHFDEELTIATSEIDLKRVVVTKDIAGGVSPEEVIGHKFARFSRAGTG